MSTHWMNWAKNNHQLQSGQTIQLPMGFSMIKSIKAYQKQWPCAFIASEMKSEGSNSPSSGHQEQPTSWITAPNTIQQPITRKWCQFTCQKSTVQQKCKSVLSNLPCLHLTMGAQLKPFSWPSMLCTLAIKTNNPRVQLLTTIHTRHWHCSCNQSNHSLALSLSHQLSASTLWSSETMLYAAFVTNSCSFTYSLSSQLMSSQLWNDMSVTMLIKLLSKFAMQNSSQTMTQQATPPPPGHCELTVSEVLHQMQTAGCCWQVSSGDQVHKPPTYWWRWFASQKCLWLEVIHVVSSVTWFHEKQSAVIQMMESGEVTLWSVERWVLNSPARRQHHT